MAKYDQGGGCACGLHKECTCGVGQADGSRPMKKTLVPLPRVKGKKCLVYCGDACNCEAGEPILKTTYSFFGQTKERQIEIILNDIIKEINDEIIHTETSDYYGGSYHTGLEKAIEIIEKYTK